MKVSTNWIQEYLGFDLPATNELVERIGSQLGAVEETIAVGAKYAGVVIVKVVECSKLENSDHLNLCFVDDGGVTSDVARREDGLVQVVCGAPNVTAGVFVAWLPPGATVPSTFDTDPFVLEARELRGAVSNGMLASAKELAIGDSHEGLLLLEGDLKPGANFAEVYKLNDTIIDIENKMFTHRPDCFGQLGVAREVAGILGHSFSSPDWYSRPTDIVSGSGLSVTVQNELPTEVPRFMAVALNNVTIAPSPVWLQTLLSRVGVRPINNVVDVTNYMMLLTGQPLHAYDYDKVAALSDGDGATIVVRHPQDGEKLELLSGKTITPRTEAIMIATNTQAIGLGGVMGGGNTEVDATTTSIILECATFDMYSIRRTSMAHGLFTDAVTRFNKGQSPLQNPAILAKSVALFQELASAQVASEVVDENYAPAQQPTVVVESTFINKRLGLQLGAADMAQLLTNVEFNVDHDQDTLTVHAPFWRTDIEVPEDVVEEVGRLHGFDKLPLELPLRALTPATQNDLLAFKSTIRRSLATAGANEVLSYSFVPGSLLDKVSQPRDQAFKVSNALSPDLQYYRFNALPSLLDKVHANIKAGYDEFALFELSKGHTLLHKDDDEGGVPKEFAVLDMVYASKTKQAGAPFYHARRLLDALANDLGIELSCSSVTDDPGVTETQPYDLARSAYVTAKNTGQVIGVIGELKQSVLKNLKLPAYSAAYTLDVEILLAAAQQTTESYQSLPRFPKVEQDICFRVPLDLPFSTLETFVTDTLSKQKPAQTKLSIATLDIYKRQDDDRKQITFRIGLASYQKTMTDTEMTTLLSQLTDGVLSEFSAERV